MISVAVISLSNETNSKSKSIITAAAAIFYNPFGVFNCKTNKHTHNIHVTRTVRFFSIYFIASAFSLYVNVVPAKHVLVAVYMYLTAIILFTN